MENDGLDVRDKVFIGVSYLLQPIVRRREARLFSPSSSLDLFFLQRGIIWLYSLRVCSPHPYYPSQPLDRAMEDNAMREMFDSCLIFLFHGWQLAKIVS